jgi:hypothetical protein
MKRFSDGPCSPDSSGRYEGAIRRIELPVIDQPPGLVDRNHRSSSYPCSGCPLPGHSSCSSVSEFLTRRLYGMEACVISCTRSRAGLTETKSRSRPEVPHLLWGTRSNQTSMKNDSDKCDDDICFPRCCAARSIL